jgi:alkylation response protein AidB-like acyl-CoA dehydrogenase
VEGKDIERSAFPDAKGGLIGELLLTRPPATRPVGESLGANFEKGSAWVHFPVGCGGRGLSRRQASQVDERLRASSAPNLTPHNPIGYNIAALSILTVGRDDQKQRCLSTIFTCEGIWCQLFSGPNAGSDLANLVTRAERDGDERIVDGQRVWSTFAHTARYGLLLARSYTKVSEHKGITFFVVEMGSDGIEVRLRQITGDAEFNEIYLTDVRIHDRNRLSEIGDGWSIASTTLMDERAAIESRIAPPGAGNIGIASSLYRHRPHSSRVYRDRLVRLCIETFYAPVIEGREECGEVKHEDRDGQQAPEHHRYCRSNRVEAA